MPDKWLARGAARRLFGGKESRRRLRTATAILGTYLGLGVRVDGLAEDKDGDVVLADVGEDRVCRGGELGGLYHQAGFLQRLALGAGEDSLAVFEVAARELPRAAAVAAESLTDQKSAARGVADHGADADARLAGGRRGGHFGYLGCW